MLADRIELVIVAFRTFHRQTKPNLAGRIDPVGHALETILLYRVSLAASLWSIAMKPGRQSLLDGRIGQHVSSQLINGKLVEGHVSIQRPNDPVPVGPNLALLVIGKAARVGIAREVEPILGAAFGIVTCRYQTIYQTIVGVG